VNKPEPFKKIKCSDGSYFHPYKNGICVQCGHVFGQPVEPVEEGEIAPNRTIEVLAREIVSRIVRNTIGATWTRNIEELQDSDAEFPTEEELIIDALSLALGDDIGCLDPNDDDFRERVDVLWLEDLLKRELALKAPAVVEGEPMTCCEGSAPLSDCYVSCGGTKPDPQPLSEVSPRPIEGEPTGFAKALDHANKVWANDPDPEDLDVKEHCGIPSGPWIRKFATEMVCEHCGKIEQDHISFMGKTYCSERGRGKGSADRR
jgi:hypothetical protein